MKLINRFAMFAGLLIMASIANAQTQNLNFTYNLSPNNLMTVQVSTSNPEVSWFSTLVVVQDVETRMISTTYQLSAKRQGVPTEMNVDLQRFCNGRAFKVVLVQVVGMKAVEFKAAIEPVSPSEH